MQLNLPTLVLWAAGIRPKMAEVSFEQGDRRRAAFAGLTPDPHHRVGQRFTGTLWSLCQHHLDGDQHVAALAVSAFDIEPAASESAESAG